MSETTDETVPPGLRDALLGERIYAKITHQLQVQLEDGTWDLYGMPTDDREALQRTQDFRARKYPDERRRVVEHQETWIVTDIEEPGRDPGPPPPSLPTTSGAFKAPTSTAAFLAANPQHDRRDADSPGNVSDSLPESKSETSD